MIAQGPERNADVGCARLGSFTNKVLLEAWSETVERQVEIGGRRKRRTGRWKKPGMGEGWRGGGLCVNWKEGCFFRVGGGGGELFRVVKTDRGWMGGDPRERGLKADEVGG